MITITRGNLLEADVEALVNTVNCVGYMGKGIALQFKRAFPENFTAYKRACRADEVQPGRMFVFPTGRMVNPKFIINFPTKRHWRGNSRIEDIQAGLEDLIRVVRDQRISSIAVPPLGSGLGGLDWEEVRPMIECACAKLPDVEWLVFEPAGTPSTAGIPVQTSRPNLTLARALLVSLVGRYKIMAYRLTLLEMHKLAYFLQEAGEPLRLKYEAGHYGPYAHNLNKVLEALEGHFIKGYVGTHKPDVEIDLLPGSVDEAGAFLSSHEESSSRLERVSDAIEGFQTPYGMELLSSVHWVGIHATPAARDADQAVLAVHRWNERKQRTFKAEHLKIAWAHLHGLGWLGKE